MGATIDGGYYRGAEYSGMYFNEDKYTVLTEDQKYYFIEGIVHDPLCEEGKEPAAVLVFDVQNDNLVYAEKVMENLTADDHIQVILDELTNMARIEAYTGQEKISDLSGEERTNLEVDLSYALKAVFDSQYVRGTRSLNADLSKLMDKILDETADFINWRDTLLECYETAKEISLSAALIQSISEDGHEFLSDLDARELSIVTGDAVKRYQEHLYEGFGNSKTFRDYPEGFGNKVDISALEIMLADAHYAYTSVRDNAAYEQEIERE